MRWMIVIITLAGSCLALAAAPKPSVNGDRVIRAQAGKSEIVITTKNRLAGAIHSLTWDGKEFIDSFDHGRQLQSASSFDCGHARDFWAECFNPTEAGSRRNGAGPTSTSKLLRMETKDGELSSTTQMAFWLAPGEKSANRPALNTTILSQHRITKNVQIGYKKLPQVINYHVTFTVPQGERHTYAQFEALTGYMPAEFATFWKFMPATGTLEELSDGPGEQEFPIVFSTRSGSHAMGVYSPDQPSTGFEKSGYGRFRFMKEKVVKWNCVFRTRDRMGITAGDKKFQIFVPVGTKEQVRRSLIELIADTKK